MTTTPFFFFSSHQNFGTSAIQNTCPPIQFLYCILSWKSKATPMLQFRTRTNVRLTHTRSVYWCGVPRCALSIQSCPNLSDLCGGLPRRSVYCRETSQLRLPFVWAIFSCKCCRITFSVAPAIFVAPIFMKMRPNFGPFSPPRWQRDSKGLFSRGSSRKKKSLFPH